ncbi:hypothetical protein NW762_011314 [Fusarium torreyae]|uniref:Uncharacterized protein n=1 Tax=Fusarium torreyae TaxID=1237075 RepID=A0A9W8V9M2_9HYPO|nr:hypothetical protein NW762_011314 [Fusarium torreyae]
MADDTQPSDLAPPAADYTLDITFGVSIKTLRCLNEIVELSRMKRNMSPDESWPGDRLSRLSQLEAEIFETLDDLDAFSGESVLHFNRQEGIPIYVAEVIRENHLWAFHYSTAIFFRRALCDGSQSPQDANSSSTAPPSGQYLVSKALEHLENIDTLTRDQAVANTLWPGFIAAVEAVETDSRHRALACHFAGDGGLEKSRSANHKPEK